MIPFDSVPLPSALTGQKRNIFSNIKIIHEFHETKLLSKLMECGYEPTKIAKVFTDFIDDHHFDIYIIFVLNQKKSEKLCQTHEYFFKQLQSDQFQIRSFLLQPVQRLPRYKLLMAELAKEVLEDLDNNKSAVAACCVAEKTIQRFLQIVNQYCEL